MSNGTFVVHRDCEECYWSGATEAVFYRGEIFWDCPACFAYHAEVDTDDDPFWDPYDSGAYYD